MPPRGFQVEQVIERARDAEDPRRRRRSTFRTASAPGARLSALSLAVLIEQQAGIETLLHYACRDRNLLGIQSDLLGAHAMGIRNLLLITGDPGRVGDYPDATAVFDVDSIGLTNVVSRLNRGCDVGGQAIGAPTAFHIGVSVNPGAPNLDEELRRFEYKVEAGAEFVVTRPIFDVAGVRAVPEAARAGAASDRRRACFRSRACATRSSWRTRCPACACPRRCSSGCGAPTAPRRRRPRGSPLPARSRATLRRSVQGIQVATAVGRHRRPRWPCSMDFGDRHDVMYSRWAVLAAGTGLDSVVLGLSTATLLRRLMALFEPHNPAETDEILGSDAATRALVGHRRRERSCRRAFTKSLPRSTTSPSARRCIRAASRPFSGWASSPATACSRSASAPASTRRLYPRDCAVTGIDLSDSMLEKARDRIARKGVRNVRLLEMDAANLKFADDTFDIVYAPYVISVVPDPVAVAREMRRVCRPGGRIVILNHFRSKNRARRVARAGDLAVHAVHIGFKSDLDLPAFLAQADLKPVSIEKVNVPRIWSLVTCIKD